MTTTQTTSPSYTNQPIVKLLINLFEFILPLAWLSAFAFANGLLITAGRTGPLSIVLPELILITFIVVGGTYMVHKNAFEVQRKTAENIKMRQAAGAEIDPEDEAILRMEIPAFSLLLKRHALLAVFYVPVAIIVMAVSAALFAGIIEFVRNTAVNRYGAKLLGGLLAPLPLAVWAYGMFTGGKYVAKFVDERLMRVKIELPESAEARQKRREREAMAGGSKGILSSIGGWLAETASRIVMQLLIFLAPVALIIFALQNTALPEEIKMLILIPIMIGFPLAMLVFLPKVFMRRMEQRVIKGMERAITEARTPEEVVEIQRELDGIKSSMCVQERSAESNALNRVFGVFVGMIALVLILGLGVGVLARFSGANGEVAQAVMAAVLCVGVLVIMIGGGAIALRFAPQPISAKLLEGYESAMRKGDYDTLISIADHAMNELPNWETKIPGAAAYAQVGRIEEAEKIARDVLRELVNVSTGDERREELLKPVMVQVFGLLAEMFQLSGRLDEAEEQLQHALELGGLGFPTYNTIAKQRLLQGDVDAALTFIDEAEQGYIAAGHAVSGHNVALRAWAMALRGNHEQVDNLMADAVHRISTENQADRSEIYYLGGFVARAQGKANAARRSFEKAAELDPGSERNLRYSRSKGTGLNLHFPRRRRYNNVSLFRLF